MAETTSITPSQSHKHANRLTSEHSPYLLQHAHNPVNWYPWTEEAFEEARKRDVPIFLSSRCHAMEVESFENEVVVKLLNVWFVSIKVDREERPDVDKAYMTYVQSLYGGRGWPVRACLKAWESNRDVLVKSGAFAIEQLSEALSASARSNRLSEGLPQIALNECANQLAESYDPEFGGFGTSPKFPRPVEIQLMLYQANKLEENGKKAEAEESLEMGLIANVYLDAFSITKDASYSCVARDILDYLKRDMIGPDGEIFSVEDADSAESEVSDPHNEFKDKNVLIERESPSSMAAKLGMPVEKYLDILGTCRQKLFVVRSKRPKPHLDDKVIVLWNWLVISSLARTSKILKGEHEGTKFSFPVFGVDPNEYMDVAKKAVSFIRRQLYNERTHREGGGYFNTSGEDPSDLLRVKEDYDGAEPSGNSVSAINLVRLASLVSVFEARLKNMAMAVPLMCCAADMLSVPSRKQVVLVGHKSSVQSEGMLVAAHVSYDPNRTVSLFLA
ncbi:hypothetical protein LguiB_001055 [Lonicera macranthoides]